MSEHRYAGCVPADHPCLPGHFPGRPIVPGVVLLEHVERALRQAFGAGARVRLTGLPAVKFLQPLAPGVPFEVQLSIEGATARFHCRAGAGELASGRLEFARDG